MRGFRKRSVAGGQPPAAISANGICVWLKADLCVLMRRVSKRDTRPLLKTPNPEATMQKLMEARYPVYALADLVVESRDEPHETIVVELIDKLAAHLAKETGHGSSPAAGVASNAS